MLSTEILFFLSNLFFFVMLFVFFLYMVLKNEDNSIIKTTVLFLSIFWYMLIFIPFQSVIIEEVLRNFDENKFYIINKYIIEDFNVFIFKFFLWSVFAIPIACIGNKILKTTYSTKSVVFSYLSLLSFLIFLFLVCLFLISKSS